MKDALHLRGLALYSAVLVASVAGAEIWRGAAAAEVALDTARAAGAASIPILIGLAYAWLAARAATYTITDRRVVMRLGVALPMTINLPFSQIASAALRPRSDGTGEIRLQLTGHGGLSWIMIWPHARVGRTAPTLRALKDADRAGQVLGRALAASVDAPIPLAPDARVSDSASESHGSNTVAA